MFSSEEGDIGVGNMEVHGLARGTVLEHILYNLFIMAASAFEYVYRDLVALVHNLLDHRFY